MKRKRRIMLIALCMLVVVVFCACAEPTPQTTEPTQAPGILHAYTQAIKEDVADGLQLTIYPSEVYSLGQYPQTIEDFLDSPVWDTKKIVVSADSLRWNLSLLRKLDDSVLRPITDETKELYEDVRIYYVFELNGEKILDVAINAFYSDVIVNGAYMEYDPVFIEIIAPFVSESKQSNEGPRDW